MLLAAAAVPFATPSDSHISRFEPVQQMRSSDSVPQDSVKPSVIWDEAHTNGWSDSSRTANEINRIVIHVTQGSYAGAVSWFKNSDAGVAAHYTINNHDAPYSSNLNHPEGEITQQVSDEDIGYHDANANANSIGIEHSAYLDPDDGYRVEGGFSDEMYNSSARLVAWLTFAYDIPVDRHFIVGHVEDEHFGGTSSHQDPGPDWDWPRYIDLVRHHRGFGSEAVIDTVVEVTEDVPVHRGPFDSSATGLQAHAGELYHAVGQCACGDGDYLRIWFNGSESTWVRADAVRAVPNATLLTVDLSDRYDWLNVRAAATTSGDDIGNVFHGQSYVMASNGTWQEFWFAGRPTAFSHSAYLTERWWEAPPPEPIPGCTNESALNYDANATVDDGTCVFPKPDPNPVPGCTDESALNHDLNATVDDGSCHFPVPEPEPEPDPEPEPEPEDEPTEQQTDTNSDDPDVGATGADGLDEQSQIPQLRLAGGIVVGLLVILFVTLRARR